MELDAQAFKDTMSRFPSGVTVVTAMLNDVPSGMTVSAFAAVSLDPPRVSISVSRDADTLPVIERAGHFAVHILGHDQSALGLSFAKLLPDVSDPFAGLVFAIGIGGSPILPACVAWLECRVESTLLVGDHSLIIGAPLLASSGDASYEPVIYYDRHWRTLA